MFLIMQKECEKLKGCPFFNEKMKNMPATASGYKRKFCLGNNTTCARYIVSQKLGNVEELQGLFPNQFNRVEGILNKYATV